MKKYFIITWQAPGGTLYFFRGDERYEIYLPYISADHVPKGWVEDEAYARIFDAYPDLDTKTSFSQKFIVSRFNVYPYVKEIVPTQIRRPTKRPKDPLKPR